MANYRYTLLPALLAGSTALAYSPAKPVPDGWVATAQFGALVTTGNTRTQSINASLKLSHKNDRWENKLRATYLNSSTRLVKDRKDENGTVVLDADGNPVKEVVKGKATNRFFIEYQPRWYWMKRSYVFSKLDWETNKPGNIHSSSRQIGGLGHLFRRSRSELFGAEIGLGRKRLRQETGESTVGGIGYFGLKYTHRISYRAKIGAELYSDFGSDNDSTEFELSFGFELTRSIETKFRYTSRFNSDITDPSNPLDSDVDSEFTVNLEFDLL